MPWERESTFPTAERSGARTITDGYFEREAYLSSAETAAFLRDLADRLEAGSSFALTGADWELPFEYREPIEVEVELTDRGDRELEFDGSSASGDLSVR